MNQMPQSEIAVLSCNGGTESRGAAKPSRLVVGTLNGVHVLERTAGETWEMASSALEDLHIACILHEPRSGRLFAGAHWNKGLHVSEDGGRTFRPCMNGLTRPHLYTLAVQYRGDQTILYAGTEPSGLYRSLDLGESWSEIPGIWNVPETEEWKFPPPPHVAHVKQITWHPANPERLFLLVEQGALLVSEDDGQVWIENRAYADPAKDMFRHDNHRLLFREDPSQYLMCGGEGIHVTQDDGATWTQVMSRDDRIGYPDAMHIDPRDDAVLFVFGPRTGPGLWAKSGTSNPTVMRSEDLGRTWAEQRSGLPEDLVGNIEASALHAHGDEITLFFGTALGEVWQSTDSGGTWTLIAELLPPIAKNGHFRYLLPAAEKEAAEVMMRACGAEYA